VNAHLKTLLTLAVLAVLLLLGVTWGGASLTHPFPHSEATKTCYPTQLKVGDRVAPPDVTVSVFNASQRGGLAEATMSAFQDQGFGSGDVGNAPKKTVVHYAQIWTSDRTNPAVQLVKSRLGPGTAVVRRKHAGAGVVVMVGPLFQKLQSGKQSVKVTAPATICSPPTA
jgi:hypothetical protein